eukprot:7998-Chlamydomonas_euryale.AAC.6
MGGSELAYLITCGSLHCWAETGGTCAQQHVNRDGKKKERRAVQAAMRVHACDVGARGPGIPQALRQCMPSGPITGRLCGMLAKALPCSPAMKPVAAGRTRLHFARALPRWKAADKKTLALYQSPAITEARPCSPARRRGSPAPPSPGSCAHSRFPCTASAACPSKRPCAARARSEAVT